MTNFIQGSVQLIRRIGRTSGWSWHYLLDLPFYFLLATYNSIFQEVMINPEMQNSSWGAEDPAGFMSHLAVQVIWQAAHSLGHNFLGGEKELVVLWSRALWCVLLIKLRLKQVPETVSCVYRTNWKQGVWQCRRWECRVLVACREGNWVLCNTLLYFFRARHSFLRSQQWDLETLQWCYRGHSRQQSAKTP